MNTVTCTKCAKSFYSVGNNVACPTCGYPYVLPIAQPSNQYIPEKEDKHTFKSGATSSGQFAGYDMLPEVFLTRVARRFDLGKEKHGKYNYRKGLRDKEFILDRLNHAFLHLVKAMSLINNDQGFNDDDLAGVAVNIAMAMEYQETNGIGSTQIPFVTGLTKEQLKDEPPYLGGGAFDPNLRGGDLPNPKKK